MTTYDFDQIIDRRHTACLKYDAATQRGLPPDVLPFWVADMDFTVPDEIITALMQRSQHGIFGYTLIDRSYKDALSGWFTTQHNWTPDTRTLLITPGVVFAICTAIRAFTQPGDAILIQPPVYYPFSLSIEQNQRRVVTNPLVLQDGHYTIDFEDFEQKIIDQHIRMFLLCSPQNPTGRVWKPEELKKLADICLRHQVLIIADEIHQDFVYDGHTHTILNTLSPEIAQNTILCTSPSKSFNLAGLQISNIFIENPAHRRRFLDTFQATGYCEPNPLGLAAAQAAYTYGADWLRQLKAYLRQNLDRTRGFLAQELPKVHLIEPEGTYLIWLDFRDYGLHRQELDDRIIKKAHLWLDSGHIFGSEGSGFQRINIACPWATLEKGLQQLAAAFKK